jgi:hypothetical protein
MIKSKELEWIMSNCYGTEKWYRYFPNNKFLYTDGVKTFCENAEDYWFITEVFLMCCKLPEYELYEITLDVKDSKAEILVKNGPKVIKRRNIEFTDCPEGRWVFFYTDHVFMWHDEY